MTTFTQMEVSSWENNRTKWWIFQQAMVNYRRVFFSGRDDMGHMDVNQQNQTYVESCNAGKKMKGGGDMDILRTQCLFLVCI